MRVVAKADGDELVVTVTGLSYLGTADQAELAAGIADATARCLSSWFAQDSPDPRLTAYELFDQGRTVAQVAAILGVDRPTVREWKRAGRRP
ncbi:helix-turn-helix domain-containing protein [Pseudonocardia hispaniensis]|uniref:Helix-turn-helix domain-containing protein n=1 Tax=Pseudonocardia hispaniensis TaxID=904933 RepID=A0ABW1IYF6_9PSEU